MFIFAFVHFLIHAYAMRYSLRANAADTFLTRDITKERRSLTRGMRPAHLGIYTDNRLNYKNCLGALGY